MRRTATRGATLIEVLISLALVLVGMLALFAVLSSSVVGTSTASRLSQAQARALSIAASIRVAPRPALDCLKATAASSWSNCETICLTNQTGTANNQSVTVAHPFVDGGQVADRSHQLYALDPTSTKVVLSGANSGVYDVTIVVGWNDDGSATTPFRHSLTIRTGVFN
jgi:Tfp pilus assembly protein PilV